MDSPLYTYALLPLLIFLARMSDVSIGTIRIIFIAKGMRFLPSLLGFFEILIWLMAISQIMKHLGNWVQFVAYAGGFAAGNYVGILIEEKIAMGRVIVRTITQKDPAELVRQLKESGFGVTTFSAKGTQGPVNLVYTIVDRRDVDRTLRTIRQFNPKAFFSVEDVRVASEGIFPPKKPLKYFRLFHFSRRSK